MSIRFKVKHTYMTTGPAIGKNHDGSILVNGDFPKGTIYAEDAQGNLFYLRSEQLVFNKGLDLKDLKYVFGSKQYYRDHWKHISSSADAPYTASLLAAPKIKLA